MNTIIALQKAKKIIVQNGWRQGISRGKGTYCAGEALMMVGGLELLDIFREVNNIKCVAAWNDKWWRTKKSVLRAFDNAIKFVMERPRQGEEGCLAVPCGISLNDKLPRDETVATV